MSQEKTRPADEACFSLTALLGRCVVLDTPGALVYIGVLRAFDNSGYWLEYADVHDRGDGHSTKEEYINDAHLLEKSGTRSMNRRRVFVERGVVASVSALEDVIGTAAGDAPNMWIP